MDTKRTVERNSAIFILSHGRANKIFTLNTLNKCHYTGKVYILIDDQDPQADEYKRLYVPHGSSQKNSGLHILSNLTTIIRLLVTG